MARLKIKNRTELLAAIYHPDHLPTGVIINPDGGHCATLHGFRIGNEGHTDLVLEGLMGTTIDENTGDYKTALEFEPFYEKCQGNQVDRSMYALVSDCPYLKDCEQYEGLKAFADCA